MDTAPYLDLGNPQMSDCTKYQGVPLSKTTIDLHFRTTQTTDMMNISRLR